MESSLGGFTICSRCMRSANAYATYRTFSNQSSRSAAVASTASESTHNSEQAFQLTPGQIITRARLDNVKLERLPRRYRRSVVRQQIGKDALKFEEMPYQCFQEARKFLLEDRREKLQQIETQRERMEKLKAQEVAPQDEASRERRLSSMRKRLEELKIFADINDPLVKKRFEDRKGNMAKPIYRFLAERHWRETDRQITEQRITQMNVVPDILPHVSLDVSTRTWFATSMPVLNKHMPKFDRSNVKRTPSGLRVRDCGAILHSLITEKQPLMNIWPFDRGVRLVTVAFVNPDVPDVANDDFTSRCHFLAANIPISPTASSIDVAALDEGTQIIQPWLPAYAQKGLPYQRMAIIVLEQPVRENADADPHAPRSQELDVAAIKAAGKDNVRDGFSLRAFTTRHRLKAVGADLYRTIWDDDTAGVMQRAGVIGADVEFKRKKIEPLPYKKLAPERYR